MKSTFAAIAFLSTALIAPAFAAETKEATVIPAAKVDAAFGKGGALYSSENYKIQAGRREADGKVEIHTKDTDIFYVTEGSATLITGGDADAKETAANELRADKSTGGTTRVISKGDVIVIPAGVPHWIVKPTKPFLYFVVKVAP